MDRKIFTVATVSFLFLLSFFSGIILSAQILGILKLYYPIPVLLLTLTVSGTLFYICLKTVSNHFLKVFPDQDNGKTLSRTSIVGYLAGGILLTIVLVLPLTLWPLSGIRQNLAWDAGLYHLPKAAELVVSHSLLDLSIAYGEYPSGYEMLIAFSFILKRAGYLIGTAHALILIFFLLGLFLLLGRFSKGPKGILFFITVFTVASYDIFRSIESNPFQMLRVSAFDIGMNDFFLAAAIIALILFSPVGPNPENAKSYSLLGMGLSTSLILGTKPNGIFIAAGLWTIALIYEILFYRKNRITFKQISKRWLLPVLLSLLGSLWAFRNLVMIGSLFNPSTLAINQYSIMSNLSNPFFYRYLDLNFKIVLFFFFLSILFSIFWKKIHWSFTVTFSFLLLGFCATPTSAFFGSVDKPAEIAWRFGLYLLAFLLPVIFYFFDKPINAILGLWRSGFALLIGAVMIVITLYGSFLNFSRLEPNLERLIVLEDQFQESVGVGGYYSPYDYIRKNVHHSVVWVENGMPFYVFGKDLTNSITRSRNPDYYVFFQTPWNDTRSYPPELSTENFLKSWQLVYQDSEGRVYKRTDL
ncbi:MAG: hypothetical protein NTZ74_05595 [Chloroflexi bacterium]|nr:hypothetical protein [Chloroflexota bacterium]